MVVYMLSLLEAPDSFLVLNSVNNGNLFSKDKYIYSAAFQLTNPIHSISFYLLRKYTPTLNPRWNASSSGE